MTDFRQISVVPDYKVTCYWSGDAKMKQVESEKYLGDQICSGLANCVLATVNKRKGLTMKSIFDVRAVVDDLRCSVVGGIRAGLDICEL